MEVTVTLEGCEVPLQFQKVVSECMKDLTLLPDTTTPGPSRHFASPAPVKAFRHTSKALIVPYHYAKSKFSKGACTFVDKRPEGSECPHFRFKGSLLPDLHQPAAADAVLDSLRATGGSVLCLKVGMGKTALGLYVAASLRGKTLILVHKLFLAEQWAERIRQFVPMASVSFVCNSQVDTSGDFVIATIQSMLSKHQQLKTALASFRLLIADECHHIGAAVFSNVCFGLNFKYTLGLSATVERKDGMHVLIHHLLGPMAYKYEGRAQKAATVKLLHYDCPMYHHTPSPTNRLGNIDFTQLITLLTESNERTQFLIDAIVQLDEREPGRHILVLSHRRTHCHEVARLLQQHASIDAQTYLGGDKCVPSSRVVVSTYSLTSEGFDEPRLNTLVLATPASDVRQTVGRILRGGHAKEGDDAPTPYIIDVVDKWSVCYAQASKRKKTYLQNGFMVMAGGVSSTTTKTPDKLASGCLIVADD